MKMATISEAARTLKVSRQRIKRAIGTGALPTLMVGSRALINLDAARTHFGEVPANTVSIRELSEATGLTVRAIRDGIADGWLPWVRDGRAKRFVPDEVCAAIDARMQGPEKT